MKKELLDEIRRAFHSCLYEQGIQKDLLYHILDKVMELYHIETVFFTSNIHYQYQIDVEWIRKSAQRTEPKTDTLYLTESEYETMCRTYSNNSLSDVFFFQYGQTQYKAVLHCGILNGSEYIGTIGFCDRYRRVWLEEEKEILQILSKLYLLFMGLRQLDQRANRLHTKSGISIHEHTLSCFYLNLMTGKCHGILVSDYMKVKVSEWTDYSTLLKVYSHYFMEPVYGKKLLTEYSLEKVKSEINKDHPMMSIDYPRIIDNTSLWVRMKIKAIRFAENGQPYNACLTFEDITEETRTSAFMERAKDIEEYGFVVLSCLDLDTERYTILIDHRKMQKNEEDTCQVSDYRFLLQNMEHSGVHHEFIEDLKNCFSIENLKKAFDEKQMNRITFEFPYDHEQCTYWIRVEAIPANEYHSGNRKIMFYYNDITRSKLNELQLEKMNKELLHEQGRVREKEQQLLLDPLTGIYNRQGFEKLTAALRGKKTSIGFIMVDIDHFKDINDQFGHEYGDQVLKTVAGQLKTVFRKQDKAFRIGGDEFAVLLCNCNSEAWKSIRDNFRKILRYLSVHCSKDIDITLSAGVCLSSDGYTDDLYQLADEALYITKRNGRAGITQIDVHHQVKNNWKDHKIDGKNQIRSLKQQMGNWRIEIFQDESKKPCLFCDEATRLILGFPETLDEVSCYARWVQGISDDCRDTIVEMKDKIFATGQAECTYMWQHPQDGLILMRTGAVLVKDGEKKEIIGYHQSLKDTSIVLRKNDNQFLIQAMNSINFCAYYFELDSREYYTFKNNMVTDEIIKDAHTISETLDEFVKTWVHPDDLVQVEQFMDIDTLAERLENVDYLDCEYLTTSDKGWCRSRFLPVKWNKDGHLTHALYTASSIDASKRKALEKERAAKEAMRMQIRVGEIISKSTVLAVGFMDKPNGNITVWDHAIWGMEGQTYQLDAYRQWAEAFIIPEDKNRFEQMFTYDYIQSEIAQKKNCSMIFRILNQASDQRTIMLHFEDEATEGLGKMIIVVEDITNTIPKGVSWMKEFEILDSINESIAIFDYETYQIVYMNKIARKTLHVDMETLRTKKCYELFGDDGHPCDFCDKVLLDSGKAGYMIRQVKGTEGASFIHGSVMEINEKKYRIEHAVPVSQIDHGIEELQGMLTAEQKLLSCIQTMYGMEDHYEALAYLLDQIIAYYESDRAIISKMIGKKQGKMLMERCNAQVIPKFKNGICFDIDTFMQWDHLYQPIMLKRNAALDNGAQQWMEQCNLENLKILAFEYGENEIGCITIDNCKKHLEEDSWISTLAIFIATKMQKIEKEEALTRLSYYDTLTSCKNRNALIQYTAKLKSQNCDSIGLIKAGINGLKIVNGIMGHQFGDQMLKRMVNMITECYDIEQVYRVNGDEFVIVICDISQQDFLNAAEALVHKLETEEEGIAAVGHAWSNTGEDLMKLEKRADVMMKSEKQYYHLTHQNEHNKRPSYIRHAAEALARSVFVVYFQPKCYVNNRQIYGAEALVRRIDEKGNAVAPMEFLHVLEQENLISNVDYFILEKVCETLVEWQKEGKQLYQISCNFSRFTVAEKNFTDKVIDIIEKTGVDPSRLIFEITESSNAVPFEKLTKVMMQLKEKNITFALDNMGTEIFTLQMLKLPAITAVKFDMRMISQFVNDEQEKNIMKYLIHMCHGLGMECVAEGVETEEQLEVLMDMHCDKMQGYLIGAPMSLEEFTEKYV